MLFPDEEKDYPTAVYIKREDLEQAVAQTHVALPSGLTHRLDAFVVGCVVYQSPNSVKYHETTFIYAVMKADSNDHAHTKNLPLTVGEPVSISDVRLLPWESGAVGAN
jgi:mannitol/fructose-specific phosphotransferase system IIA component